MPFGLHDAAQIFQMFISHDLRGPPFVAAYIDDLLVASQNAEEREEHGLAVETIELLLRKKYDETENLLGHAQIVQLLKFCLKTYFIFDRKIYEQVKGTPMGSPISGRIAEEVLQRLESLVF
nr:unnamed protein product [Spirometra erinaceieuropaei]